MSETFAIVVSDLYPNTDIYDNTDTDSVYVAVELEITTSRPHKARVVIPGVRKGDRVRVAVRQSGMITTYSVIGKMDPLV